MTMNFFGNFKTFDPNSFKETMNDNIKAMNKASEALMKGFQSVSEKNMGLLQRSAQQGLEYFKECLTSGNNVQALQKAQTNYVQETMQSVANNTREVLAVASEAGAEVMHIANDRFNQCVNEANSACQAQRAAK